MLLPGLPLALGVEIGLDVVDEGPAVLRPVVGVDGLARLFVDEDEVLVLIDDVQLRRRDGEIGVSMGSQKSQKQLSD